MSTQYALLQPNEVRYSVELVNNGGLVELTEVRAAVELQNAPPTTLHVVKEEPSLEVVPNALTINQLFSGEGAVADGTTITGDGTSADPLSVAPSIVDQALGSFQIVNNLSEIPTEVDRKAAQQNLGLHIIDGGTFL